MHPGLRCRARSNGETVWRRLEGELIPAILRIETLELGQVLRLSETWDQRSNRGDSLQPGSYRIRGEVLMDDQLLVTPTEPLELVSRLGP